MMSSGDGRCTFFIGHCANTRCFAGSRPAELIVAAEGSVN